MRHVIRILCSTFCFAGCACVALGEEDLATDEAKAWQLRRLAECEEFEVVRALSSGEKPLKLEKTPALSWTNPIRKTAAGAVFLWTDDGRPQLIASTYRYEQGIEYEFTSLSADVVVLRRNGGNEERIPSGIEWHELPEIDPPHKQRALRLAQMRRIAEQVQVRGGAQNRFDTRLLTQPIYRSPAEAITDIAIFAFVQGTDPEAVLIAEATDKPAWRYAFGRMSSVPLTADYKEAPVWKVGATWETPKEKLPFHTIRFPGVK